MSQYIIICVLIDEKDNRMSNKMFTSRKQCYGNQQSVDSGPPLKPYNAGREWTLHFKLNRYPKFYNHIILFVVSKTFGIILFIIIEGLNYFIGQCLIPLDP